MTEKEIDKPEVLEFLKQTRIIIRQLKIFKGTKSYVVEESLIKKAVEDLSRSVDEYLEGE